MRAVVSALFVTASVVGFSCSKESGDKTSGGGGAKTDDPGVAAGTLAVVSGEILPAEGADPSTVSGALVQAEGRPEVSAVTDEDGKFVIENALPGTVALYVGSNDGGTAALQEGKAIGPTAYGLKLPDVVLKSGEVTELGQQALKKTGGFSGKVVFYSNPNKLDLTGSEVFVPGTGFIVKTDATGAFALSGLPPGKYDIRAQHTGFAVLDVKGIEVLEGQTADIGNLTLSLSTGPEGGISVVEDKTADIGGNSKAKIVETRKIKINLNYDSDAALMKVSDEPSFTNKEWKPVKGSVDWEFTSDGLKSLYVMYSDLNGLESSPYKDEVYIDTTDPVLNSVSILNGWATTAADVNPASLSATDGGSGVGWVQYRLGNDNFSDNQEWTKFGETIDVDVGSTHQPVEVFVRVKDHLGRISNVVSDEISRASATEIFVGEEYDYDVTLKAAQSPFELPGHATFNKKLTIEPGVTLTLKDDGVVGAMLKVRGAFHAVGTNLNSGKILIQYHDDDECDGSLDLKEAAPGVSNNTLISNVEFLRVSTVSLNGGTLTNNRFWSTGCALRSGEVRKYGKDSLTLIDSKFDNWGVGLEVREGNGTATIKGSTGNLKTLVKQLSPANGTKVQSNTVSVYNTFGEGALEIDNGSLEILSGNSFSGTGTIVKTAGSGARSVSGITVTECGNLAYMGGSGTLTISDSTIAGCASAVGDSPGTVVFRNNDMQFKLNLVHAGPSHAATVTFDRNNITLNNNGSATGYADLFVITNQAFFDPDLNVTMTDNNITCNDEDGCRGGMVAISSSGADAPTGTFSVAFDGNHWTGLAPVGLPPATHCTGVLICEDYIAYAGGDLNRVKDGTKIAFYEFMDGHVLTNHDANDGTPDVPMSKYDVSDWEVTGDFTTNNPFVDAAGND